MASAKTTTDHDEIRTWVEERDGFPARVTDTGGADDPGILRIDFDADGPDEGLERIEWEEWFEAFEENDLAFLYQDEKSDGETSTFNKLVSRSGDDD